jgi:8-oxo-dGTP diphosphatase
VTLPYRTDGDGWVDCACGRRHWGRYGAAGLMLLDNEGRVLLQHRAAWSHEGGTWALPGGARSSAESALQTALREAAEEAGVLPEVVVPSHCWIEDHGPWSYATVVGHARGPVEARATDPESLEIRWVDVDDVASRPLHPAFGAAWPTFREQATRRLILLVDSANVVGSRPNRWWKDRLGANARLRDDLAELAVGGLPAKALGLPAEMWWPEIRLVVEGQARNLDPTPGVTVLAAETDGDTLIAETAQRLRDEHAGDHVVVVTADRELRSRVEAAGARVVGPANLLRLLGAA